MKYIIGIDCGASSSEAVIVPQSGSQPLKIVVRERFTTNLKNFPPLNYNILGFDKAARRLLNIVRGISKDFGLENVKSVIAGVSGARFEKDRQKLAAYIRNKTGIKKVKILPDTEIALASAFARGEKNCGILIAGTGSILYYRDGNGKINRIGGWGRFIGDEGSGYWIAREAFRYVTKAYDLRGIKSLLSELFKKHFDINNGSIIQKIYHEDFDIASAARLVFRAAGMGDRISKDIIKRAAAELAEHLKPLKSNKRKKCRIALTGSLFSEEKLLEKELRAIAKSKFPNIQFIKPDLKPVWGAVRIARGKFETR